MARHRHRKHNYSKKRTNKNFINKTVGQGVSIVKSTSRKYMPKVKSGLENVGSTVIEKTVPYLQRLTRKFFGLFSGKTRKNRKNRKH
jgi:hypothetical protein